jgi:hypothetical protein
VLILNSSIFSASVLAGSSALTIDGHISWLGGTIGGSNPILVTSSGSFDCQGAVALSRPLANSGILTIAGEMNAGVGAVITNQQGGIFRPIVGTASVAPDFYNEGLIDMSAANLQMHNFTQAASGTIQMFIGGSTVQTYSQLSVTAARSAWLDGNLSIQLTNNYMPTVSNRFQIITCGSRTGTFAAFTRDSLNNGKFLNLSYSPQMVELYTSDGAPNFNPIQWQPGGAQLQLNGVIGQNYAIDATIDFQSWQPLVTNTVPANAVLSFTDPNGTTFPQRFYRARFLP